MLRSLSAGVVLLVVATTVAAAAPSTAAAGAHYVEVWNPPEARIASPVAAAKSRVKPGKTALLARSMGKAAAPHRIADRLSKASTTRRLGIDAAKKTTSPRFIDIPRILTPEGNVLQVSTGRMAVSVVR
ncbi:hypothetical protein P3T24_000971 [Paraburkholderia sp. GAS33]|jgi:hypothetical protein|uniref:hypothetical protein n=1 Tax=Paraburkholderia sp. GAS33 TaxID=3035130 RepID=UPI003D1DA41E